MYLSLSPNWALGDVKDAGVAFPYIRKRGGLGKKGDTV